MLAARGAYLQCGRQSFCMNFGRPGSTSSATQSKKIPATPGMGGYDGMTHGFIEHIDDHDHN
jgi:hypothetical protein